MRRYQKKAASAARVDYGEELGAGLRRFPETAQLAPEFAALNDGLFSAYLARLGARKQMVAARVPVRVGNYETDNVLRACAHAAEQADGCKGGPIFKSVFKDGLRAAVKPNGARQIPATETVIADMKKSAAHGIEAFRAEWQPKIEASLATLSASADNLSAARKLYLDSFQAEIALRNQHWTAIDKIMGQVRASFPGNTAKQDLIFPETVDEEGEPAAEKANEEKVAPAGAAPTPTPTPVTVPSAGTAAPAKPA